MPSPRRLLVDTREIAPVDDLIALADPHRPLAWLRRGDGLVAAAEPALAIDLRPDQIPHGDAPARAALLARAWREATRGAEIDDPVGVPGSGLVAFGVSTFDERSAMPSRLVVPRRIVGLRGGRAWVTRVRLDDEPETASHGAAPAPWGPSWSGSLGPGALGAAGYQDAVRDAVRRIGAGAAEKIVLARDLAGSVPIGADLRRLVRSLAESYPDTWVYAVDGMIGASPETLVTSLGGSVTARVLAGTAARGAEAASDAAAAASLSASAKDSAEHAFAVASVLEALGAAAADVEAAERFALSLPNLWHLATDVRGRLRGEASVLDLVAALHPTAAVAGTPTRAAIEAIRALEPFDRGRYAGPVGWIDAAGDGEWAIALRGAQIGDPRGDAGDAPRAGFGADALPVTAYAGAGIVAASDPEAELQETRVKFRPIVDALA